MMKSRIKSSACFLFFAVFATGLMSQTLADQRDLTDPASDALHQQQFDQVVLPFLKNFCLDCHSEHEPEAKLDLSGYTTVESVFAGHQIWQTVRERLQAQEMPPEDALQPDDQQRQAVISWIAATRDAQARRNAGDPGPVLARRLSNAEYNYTIRDLTGVDIRPTATFPVDPANEAGFDNSGESLAMSPALLNKYLGAARQVVEHLVLKPSGIGFAPHPVVTHTDRDKYCVKRIVQFYYRQPTELADYFYAAWLFHHRQQRGRPAETLAEVAAAQGVSSRYLQTVYDLLTDSADAVGPIARLQSLWSELPGDPAEAQAARQGCETLKDFVVELRQQLTFQFPNLRIEGGNPGSQPFVLWKNRQYVEHRRKFNPDALIVGEPDQTAVDTQQSQTETAADDSATSAGTDVRSVLVVPADANQRQRYEDAFARFCSVFPDAFYISERGRDYVDESQKPAGDKGRLLSAGFHSMMGYFRDDQPLYDLILDEAGQAEIDRLWQELDFVTSAPMRQYVGFLWFDRTDSRFMRDPEFDFARAEDKEAQTQPMIRRLAQLYRQKAQRNGGGDVELGAIDHFFDEINDQIRWVEQARLDAQPSHLQAVQDFAQQAWRRPLTAAEREELLAFYHSLRSDDQLSHEEAVQDTIVAVLMSPHFCYRLDLAARDEQRRPLTDYELASRLSYFLWSSMPDQELLDVAAAGQLRDPEVLVAQAFRLLQDERVRGMATEFGGNWLDFRRFEEHNAVDRERFPEFNDELRQAMFEEPIRFLTDVARHDRSVLEFLTADYTFVNPVLARHYGLELPDTDPEHWVRLDNATAYHRGGLLPMSVFLTKNAPGLRTSPVKRGYWVVRRLLGEQIPPPPPNVPELPEDESALGELTLRAALAKHREHKSCAGCHERIDSIGLVFEEFGPVGEFRELDLGGRPVDSSATFPGGTQGSGVEGLRTYLQNYRQDDFLDNLSRKLLSYALGRSLILSDELLVQDMRQQLAADDHRFSSLVKSIVTSPQFLTKRGGTLTASE